MNYTVRVSVGTSEWRRAGHVFNYATFRWAWRAHLCAILYQARYPYRTATVIKIR